MYGVVGSAGPSKRRAGVAAVFGGGPDNVARWILGVLAKPSSASFEPNAADINGELGALASFTGNPGAAFTFDLVDDHIQNLRFQVNPGKLAGLYQGTDLLG